MFFPKFSRTFKAQTSIYSALRTYLVHNCPSFTSGHIGPKVLRFIFERAN